MSAKRNNADSWPEVLKAWRARRGFTQKQAAEFLGVSLPTIRKWEQGASKPTFLAPSIAREIVG